MTDRNDRTITHREQEQRSEGSAAVGTALDEQNDKTTGSTPATDAEKTKEPEPANDKARAAGHTEHENQGKTKDDDEEIAPTAGGFEAFRLWLNRKIRNQPTTPTIQYGEKPWLVEELLTDGSLRMKNPDGEDFNLVPFDERSIPSLIAQIMQ